ncbi:MAG TPA: glutathione S-transferase N-terminal domain-containing protein [Stellaceae bacterium]|nr:glutathione S-transferase N-terminal domain-containing protein [Stellaceae bacterium]
MIELYGLTSPNVYKVAIMLEEVGLPYRLHYVNVFAEDQYRPDFLAISPTNKVPAIVDSEGPGGKPLTLCESGAILIYLAEKSGKLLSADPAVRATTMQWLMIQMASIGPMFGQYMHFLFFAQQVDYGIARYRGQVTHLLELLDRRLGEARWIAGDDYSIADVAVFPWVRRATEVFPWLTEPSAGGLVSAHPNLHRWHQAASARPATRRGIEQLETLADKTNAAFQEASDSGLDHFLLRGGG